MKHPLHPFHDVQQSPWPFIVGLNTLLLVMGLSGWFHLKSPNLLILSIALLVSSSFQWWRDISREATYQGLHSSSTLISLQWGMILFIASEIMFFFSFFWAYFHSSLTPVSSLGGNWPSSGVSPISAMEVPLLNTAVLLSSGVTITWAHHSLLSKNFQMAKMSLLFTVMLGLYFTCFQGWEFSSSPFSMADSVFGSIFFTASGFHGLHVIIGSIFLLTILLRMYFAHLSPSRHVGFEASAWYWHFVDVVWLFLFSVVYWSGG